MNDYKITLNKRQEHFLSRLLPKGYSFQLYKVRKNINDYPYKEFDKKYKKAESIILSKRQSVMFDSLEPSEKSFRQKSQVPSIPKENLSPFQMDLLWLVKKLRKHQSSYAFRAPVDPKALQVPDYFDVVLEPIDLKTIEQQIRADHYHHLSEFERDIYKMLMNSYKFNQKSTTTYNKTIQFEEFFSDTMKQWEKLKEEEQGQPKDYKDEVKEEMVEENATMTMRNEEMERKMEGFNLWNYKENNSSGIKENNASGLKENIPVAVTPPLQVIQSTPISQKKEPKASKPSTDPNPQRPRVSKKKLPKIQQVIKQSLPAQSRQVDMPLQHMKRQEQQFLMQLQEEFLPVLMQQQGVVPVVDGSKKQQELEVKHEESEQINDELRDYLENETVKEQNFSEGYNEFNAGNKIRNIEVQKEITSLLKKLNQYPLTKQKKNKLLSKFTNLDQNMTQTDKKRLFEKISKLDQNDIQCVIRILTRGKQELLKQDSFELDLDKTDSKVLREIQNFIAIRDNVTLAPIQNNEALLPVTQSLEIIKLPKKVKKEQKKILKKKLSRKNSNNDQSFSINPPQIKKRKSQKPHKKHYKGDQQSSLNAQINSMNDQKSSSSSYRPQALHQSRPATVQHIHKPPETQKTIHGATQQKQKPSYEQKKRQQQSSLKHNNNNNNNSTSHHYDPNQIFITPNPQPYHHHHTCYHYQANNYDDIDQFLVSSSKPFPNDPQSSPQHGPFTSGRKKRQSLDQLDYIYDPNLGFGKSGLKDYGDEEIKEYSMEQQGELDNDDEDQFM